MKALNLFSDVNLINAAEVEERIEGIVPLRFPRALLQCFESSVKRSVAAMQSSLICELPVGVRKAEFVIKLLDSDGYGFVGECYIGRYKHLPNIYFTAVGQTYRFEVNVPEWIENEAIRFYFPTHCTLAIQSIRVDAEQSISLPPSKKSRWIVQGDSITQGANCSAARMTWPDLVARELNVDVLNLGIGGFGDFDPLVAQYMASLPMDFVSIHCGANMNGTEDHRHRIRHYLSSLLDSHPALPCLVVSPIACLTRDLQPIRDQIREVVESFKRSKLRYIDGLNFVDCASALNSDGLHLNDWGEIVYHQRMVQEFRKMGLSSSD